MSSSSSYLVEVPQLTILLTKLYLFDDKTARAHAMLLAQHGLTARTMPYKLRTEADVRATGITDLLHIQRIMKWADKSLPSTIEIRSFLESKVGLSCDDAQTYAAAFTDYGMTLSTMMTQQTSEEEMKIVNVKDFHSRLIRTALQGLATTATTPHEEPVLKTIVLNKNDKLLTTPTTTTALPGTNDLATLLKTLPWPHSFLLGGNDRKSTKEPQHSGSILSVTWSPTRHWICSSSVDHSVRVFDTECNPIASLFGHTESVYAITFSHDGSRIFSASDDCTIRVWRVSDWMHERTMIGHTDWVRTVACSPKSTRTIASGSGDKTIKIWNPESGQVIKTLVGHEKAVRRVLYSPLSDSIIISASWDRTIKYWDLDTGTVIKTLSGQHDDQIWTLAIGDNGEILTSGSRDGTLVAWNFHSGQVIAKVKAHGNSVSALAMLRPSDDHPNGHCVSGSWGEIKCWSLPMLENVRVLDRGAIGYVWSLSQSPMIDMLCSGAEDKSLKFWSV